ncbi:hypothetical protein C5Y96_26570 [Blastopirellula marina]|uniref:SLA1 homology domain-containing protein n=1 Tax=Blastopirellula marina TaxID=124 RepID=A0A2S8EYS5_9BACT|nr:MULTISPECIES: hypothetical protein [Pirellulaceae]PQO25070.1 hypothetical protein C5Y96_26570 [Blastopirellula marina]RCS40922.1 hypothetical protein DTL36_26620 [Bremerella cremea]
MKASTFAISLFVISLLTCCAMAAEVRTWTDASGKTLSGSLEEVTSDGKVVIKSGGQSFTIPIERFSAEDKAYIDSHKDQMGDKESSSGRRRKSDLFDYRQWKDKDDNEIKAKYVRMFEGKVVLLQGRTSHKVSFYDLSDEDQIYLRRELEERGEDSQIPAPTANAGGNGTNPITGGGDQPYDPRMGNQAAMPPAYAPPEMDDFAKKQQEEHERNRREIEKQQAEARRIAEEQKRRREEEAQREQQRQDELLARETQQIQDMENRMRQNEQDMIARQNEFFGGGSNSGNQPSGSCSSCKKMIYGNIGAGDRCPHCGIFFASETDEFGRTTKTVPVPWYYKVPLPIGLIVVVVIAIFRKMAG